MAHYQSFSDDTGNDPQEPMLALSAWVGTVVEWMQFSDQWQAALDKPPQIKYYKHNEARGLTGCFNGFTQDQAVAKTLDLVDVICSYPLRGALMVIVRDEFRRIVDEQAIQRKRLPKRTKYLLTDPFYMAFHHLVGFVLGAHYAAFPDRKDRIDFIFDGTRGSNATMRCINAYELFKEDAPPPFDTLMGTAVPGDDKEILPLQAADLLAGTYRMSCQYQQETAPLHTLRMCGRPLYALILDERWIRSFVSSVNMNLATRVLTDIKKEFYP